MPKSRHAQKVLSLAYLAVIALGIFLVTRPLASERIGDEPIDEAAYAEAPNVASTTKEIVGSPQDEPITVPILVYHIVRPSYPNDSADVKKYAQTPEVFDAQLSYLARAGYHVIPFSAFENHLKSGAPLATNPIVLTFDDGWRNQFEYAFPILKKYHDTATFFIFTNAIGRHAFISWDNLREMLAAGMTVGSHSRSHPFLLKVSDPAQLWDEISESKNILEKNLGVPITEFAYPFGQYDASSTALVEKAGYITARGDYMKRGVSQSFENRYLLGAQNAPTTLERFERDFPPVSVTTALIR